MRLVDLDKEEQLDEALKDRLRNIWASLTDRPSGPGPTPPPSPGPTPPGSSPPPGPAPAPGPGKGFVDTVRDLIQGSGLVKDELSALTGNERQIYTHVDSYVKNISRIVQSTRNGMQIKYPRWNPVNSKYVGHLTVDDPEVTQADIDAIFKNPSTPTPPGSSKKKQKLHDGLRRFVNLHKQFTNLYGIKDSSQVTPKGIKIQFDLGPSVDAFKSAVQKIDNVKHSGKTSEEDLSNLSADELAQALVDDKVGFNTFSDAQKKAVLQSFPQINKSASPEAQIKALAFAVAVRKGTSPAEVTKILMQDGVVEGVDMNTLDPAMLKGIAKAMNLNVDKLQKPGIIKVIKSALTKDDIQNAGDLNKMSRNQIAALLKSGRLSTKQLAEDQVDNMLDFYKMKPNADQSKREEQLRLMVAMNYAIANTNPSEFVAGMQNGVFSADDLDKAGIPSALVQKMLISSKQQIKKSDRPSLINQLKSLEPKAKAPQKNWKDPGVRSSSSSTEVVKAIAENQLDLEDLTSEETQKLFDPNDKATSNALDQIDFNKLSKIMPEVIDKGYLKINEASEKKLQAYLKGMGFKERISGNLADLRKQAMSLYGQVRTEKISKDTIDMAKDILSDDLKEQGEQFNIMYVRSAINKAVKNLQNDDDAYQKLMAIADEDDRATELANMGSAIFFQRNKEKPGAPSSGSGPSLDKVANRIVNDTFKALQKIGKTKSNTLQDLTNIAAKMIAGELKSNDPNFAQELLNQYMKSQKS